jgi:hypothetical protein
MVAFQSGERDEAKPLSSRKQALLEHAEGSGGEQYRGGKYNGAYREDDLRFTQFLIPPGKRVLDLAAAAETCWLPYGPPME